MWSPWAWVSRIVVIGFPVFAAAARIAFEPRDHRVDQGQPVLLLDEIGVDEAEAADAVDGHFEDLQGRVVE
jgi:hypothetical protein